MSECNCASGVRSSYATSLLNFVLLVFVCVLLALVVLLCCIHFVSIRLFSSGSSGFCSWGTKAAWSSRLWGCPGPDALRSPGELGDLLDDCHDLLKAKRVDEGFVAVMERRAVRYLIAPTGSSLDRTLAPVAAFEPLYRGEEYSFYAWRRERWPPPPDD